jgi:uncharacterized protein YbjQ (UPF0145 family)
VATKEHKRIKRQYKSTHLRETSSHYSLSDNVIRLQRAIRENELSGKNRKAKRATDRALQELLTETKEPLLLDLISNHRKPNVTAMYYLFEKVSLESTLASISDVYTTNQTELRIEALERLIKETPS